MSTSAEHLIPLHDGWLLWKWIWVRGAGFPAAKVLELASSDSAALCAEVWKLQSEHARACAELAAAVNDIVWTTERAAIRRARRAAQAGMLLPELLSAAQLGPSRDALLGLKAEVDRLAADVASRTAMFETTFDAELVRIANAIQNIAGDARFREAIIWQNRAALHTAMDWLRAHPEANNRIARTKHQLVASYLQRYCVKNDYIGFFGPAAWAGVNTSSDETHVKAGRELLSKRTVYFEHWAVDELAQVFSLDPLLKPYMRPRRFPTVRVEGETVHYPDGRCRQLPAAYAQLLRACDGVTTAKRIAMSMLGNAELGLEREEEVYELLQELVDKRFCTWAFEIPTVTERPEALLRKLLDDAASPGRERALAILDTLEDKRAAVARAAGTPADLDAALQELERTFEALTGRSATRKGGQMYAGRTLVYEDCRRDLELELPNIVLRRLAPALTLVLTSARWYTHQIATRYRTALAAAFDAAARGASVVDYLVYWQHAKELFPERGRSALIEEVVVELQRKWTAIIGYDSAPRRIEVSVNDIASRVASEFAAPGPGWPGARYHSPDVMVAAPGVDALSAGNFTLVLGELHPSVSTIHFAAQKEHEDWPALIRARELDLPETIPSPVISKEHSSRGDHMWLSRHDVDIELGTTISWRPRENVIAVADLVVERVGEEIRVRDRAGRRSFEIVEFYGSYLNAAINTTFDMFPSDTHVPRITIGDVVVTREQWRPALETCAFATLPIGTAQFAAARRWAQELGLPRWVFIRVPEQPKPTFADLESPIYVDLLAKAVRQGSRVTVSEMIPNPLETWLPDASGQTYTCELRVLAVDPLRWRAPSHDS